MHIDKIKLLNWLICLIPLSLIIGNSVTNLNIVLICVLGLIVFKFEIFKLDRKILKYLLYSFFLYLILITFFQNFTGFEVDEIYKKYNDYDSNLKNVFIFRKEHTFKSLFFLRFLILFFIVNKLVIEEKFDIKLFFISCSTFSLIIGIDIFIQSTFNKSISGNSFTCTNLACHLRPASFFGNESIAGGFLQKFSYFFIFLLPFLTKIKISESLYIFIAFNLFFTILLYAGNRMPLIIFLFSFFLYFFIVIKNKKYIYVSILTFGIIFTIVVKNVSHVNFLFSSGFYQIVKTIVLNAPKLFYYGDLSETNFVTTHYNKEYIQPKIKGGIGHLVVFNSGVQVWKKNKIFGGGLKSFRLNCSNKPSYQICTTHPHNYLLEILTDTGLLGFVLFYSIIILAIFNYLKFYFSVIDTESRLISIPFFFIIFFEFFPLRSTGSFFTTANATVIFLMLAFLFNANKLKQCKVKKDSQKK